MSAFKHDQPRSSSQAFLCEADVSEGLEAMVQEEIREHFGKQARFVAQQMERPGGVVQFTYTGQLPALLKLQTVQAVYLVQRFPVPRPKALLGDEHFRKLLAQIEHVRNL